MTRGIPITQRSWNEESGIRESGDKSWKGDWKGDVEGGRPGLSFHVFGERICEQWSTDSKVLPDLVPSGRPDPRQRLEA